VRVNERKRHRRVLASWQAANASTCRAKQEYLGSLSHALRCQLETMTRSSGVAADVQLESHGLVRWWASPSGMPSNQYGASNTKLGAVLGAAILGLGAATYLYIRAFSQQVCSCSSTPCRCLALCVLCVAAACIELCSSM
jgi:hypothetical protein